MPEDLGFNKENPLTIEWVLGHEKQAYELLTKAEVFRMITTGEGFYRKYHEYDIDEKPYSYGINLYDFYSMKSKLEPDESGDFKLILGFDKETVALMTLFNDLYWIDQMGETEAIEAHERINSIVGNTTREELLAEIGEVDEFDLNHEVGLTPIGLLKIKNLLTNCIMRVQL